MSDSDFKALSDIQPTSKDCKTLIPTLIELFETMQFKMDQQFTKLREEFTKMAKEKDDQISDLRAEVSTLRKTVNKLEGQMDDNDAYERRDTLIFSGSTLPAAEDGEDCAQILRRNLKDKLKFVIPQDGISVCHRMGSKPKTQRPDTRPIIAKFCHRSTKNDIVDASRKMKVPQLFINESLTPIRQTIAYVLRKGRREFPDKVSGISTRDGRVFVWIKPPSPDARAIKRAINTRHELEDFCHRTLEKNLTHFIDNWTH